MHAHTDARARSHIHTQARAHIYTETHTYARTTTHARTHTDAHAHVYTKTHARTHKLRHAHTKTHARSHTHTLSHTHTHIGKEKGRQITVVVAKGGQIVQRVNRWAKRAGSASNLTGFVIFVTKQAERLTLCTIGGGVTKCSATFPHLPFCPLTSHTLKVC